MKKQMQNRMRARLTGVCLLGLCLSGGAATDGYYWPDWIYNRKPWGTIRYWEGDRVPGEGGALLKTCAERRMGTPDELGYALATVADERNGYLAGVDILCDGGSIVGKKFVK